MGEITPHFPAQTQDSTAQTPGQQKSFHPNFSQGAGASCWAVAEPEFPRHPGILGDDSLISSVMLLNSKCSLKWPAAAMQVAIPFTYSSHEEGSATIEIMSRATFRLYSLMMKSIT